MGPAPISAARTVLCLFARLFVDPELQEDPELALAVIASYTRPTRYLQRGKSEGYCTATASIHQDASRGKVRLGGSSPIYVAVSEGHLDIVKLLSAAGAVSTIIWRTGWVAVWSVARGAAFQFGRPCGLVFHLVNDLRKPWMLAAHGFRS